MSPVDAALDLLCVNTIRTLAIDAVEHASSGHPGMPLGAAPAAYVLWDRHLQHWPKAPSWPDRDRFVLSAGHGSMLLYALLHLSGYDLDLEDIRGFRSWGSRTPGHPEAHLVPGVEVTTGPLGQGAGNAVGLAIAERALAHRFNRPGYKVVDHFTYALVSDGDLMEGVCAEAASLAGHLRLGKLVFLYDANDVSLDGPCSMAFSENTAARFEACGWHVQTVADADTDLAGIDASLEAARDERGRPSLIILKTTIGYGSSVAGSFKAHGAPLGEEDVAATKKALGWDPKRHFHVPDPVRAHFRASAQRGQLLHEEWLQRREAYAEEYPELAGELERAFRGELPADWDADLPVFGAGEKVATRAAAGKALNALAPRIPALLGGDADLGSSTKSRIDQGGDFEGGEGAGRNIHFGVREHAMGAACNGMAHHGGLRPYASTFFCFSDYMRPSVRLAALDGLPVIYIWSHDSIGLGEDGPTHQPVEHLMSLRAMPGIHVIRPCDANEAVEAWRAALRRDDGPTALVLSRQKLPVLDRKEHSPASGLHRGGYVLAEAEGGTPQVLLIATGSEITLALEARRTLQTEDGVPTRVVSLPCWELFEDQDPAYREQVLPTGVTARVSVEAGATLGWERYIGSGGLAVGLDRFGASAPGPVNLQNLGFTPERVTQAARSLIQA